MRGVEGTVTQEPDTEVVSCEKMGSPSLKVVCFPLNKISVKEAAHLPIFTQEKTIVAQQTVTHFEVKIKLAP